MMLSNALFPTLVTDKGNSNTEPSGVKGVPICVNSTFWKAQEPMKFTEMGMVIDVRETSLNENAPIETTSEGIVIEVTEEHPSKA